MTRDFVAVVLAASAAATGYGFGHWVVVTKFRGQKRRSLMTCDFVVVLAAAAAHGFGCLFACFVLFCFSQLVLFAIDIIYIICMKIDRPI